MNPDTEIDPLCIEKLVEILDSDDQIYVCGAKIRLLDEKKLLATLEDESAPASKRSSAAGELIWLRRCSSGDTIDVSSLRLGKARVLHLPGELFVEYQLAAQKLRPDLFVAMAAYGDYGTGYIGTEIAYSQGGYETRPGVTHVAPEAESVLMDAITRLLK